MLTPTQLEAVEEISKPLCIKAGPGTGKTMLLVEKIAYLIEKKNVLSTKILSLTFTQKAAKELSSRVENRIGSAFMSYTFHSFALSILQTISKEPEQIKVLKDIDAIHFLVQKIEEYEYHEVLRKDVLFLAREVYKTINSLKDLGYTTQTISKVEFKSDYSKQIIITLLMDYEKFKLKRKIVDFHDLEMRLFKLLSKKENIAKKISNLFQYLIVDEFQDTSPLQYKILEILASYDSHLTVVGDEKQSIYGFRGTHQDSFKLFEQTFTDFKLLYLKEQFRSSKKVVEATNLFIENMSVDLNQLLNAQKNDNGTIIEIETKDEVEQYDSVISLIEEHQKNGKNIAILARTHSQLKEFIDYSSTYGVEINYGLEDIFNNAIIEKILFYLHIIDNPKASEKYFMGLFEHYPISNLVVEFVLHQSRSYELDLYSFFKKHVLNSKSLALKELKETHSREIDILIHNVSFIFEQIDKFQAHRKIKRCILEIMQYEEIYEKALRINDTKLLSTYNSFLVFIQEYERINQNPSLSYFLEYLDVAKKMHHNIVDSTYEDIKGVVAMTIHQAKGKEFDSVIILQTCEKSYPLPFREELLQHQFSITKEQALAEEKRLFFVAITRAKENIYFMTPLYNSKGMAYKRSQYLSIVDSLISKEMPKKHELQTQNNSSNQVLTQLIYALKHNNFQGAKELLKEYELMQTDSNDLRHFAQDEQKSRTNEKSVSSFEKNKQETQLYQKKDKNGEIKQRIYSVSQIKTYETCPKKYYYSYICRIPQEPKHFFSFGTAIHSVFELLMPMFDMDKKISKDEITLEALHLLSMNWRSLGYTSVEQEKEYFQKALQAVHDFVDLELKRKEEKYETLGLEEEFIIELDSKVSDKKHKLIGYIDRIDKDVNGEYHILDYKTSKSMAYQSQLREDLQLYTYALALKQLKGEFPKSMALWYVIHNRIAKVEFNEEIVKKSEDKLLEGIENIESGDFRATPSFFGCTYCDFKDICKDSLK